MHAMQVGTGRVFKYHHFCSCASFVSLLVVVVVVVAAAAAAAVVLLCVLVLGSRWNSTLDLWRKTHVLSASLEIQVSGRIWESYPNILRSLF